MPAPFNLSLYSSLMNYHFNCKFNNTNETYYKFNQFDCDILFSKYMLAFFSKPLAIYTYTLNLTRIF